MSKTKAVISVSFVLALGAGVALGMLGSRTLPQRGDPRSHIVDALQLTPEQQAQMDEIWSGLIRDRGRQYGEEMRIIQEEHDAALNAMLSSEQKQEYDRINAEFARKMQEIWKKAEQEFRAATEKTRAILSPSQQATFDEMLKQFTERAGGGWGGGAMPGGSGRGLMSPSDNNLEN